MESNDAVVRLQVVSASAPDMAAAAPDDKLREDGIFMQCTPVFKESSDQGQGRKTTMEVVRGMVIMP